MAVEKPTIPSEQTNPLSGNFRAYIAGCALG